MGRRIKGFSNVQLEVARLMKINARKVNGVYHLVVDFKDLKLPWTHLNKKTRYHIANSLDLNNENLVYSGFNILDSQIIEKNNNLLLVIDYL